jgi:hypothetical protein
MDTNFDPVKVEEIKSKLKSLDLSYVEMKNAKSFDIYYAMIVYAMTPEISIIEDLDLLNELIHHYKDKNEDLFLKAAKKLVSIYPDEFEPAAKLACYYSFNKPDKILGEQYGLQAINAGNKLNYPGTHVAYGNLGLFYKNVLRNYDKMKQCYDKAIEKAQGKHDIYTTMRNYGFYYATNEPNYELMKKYYVMAIEHKCPESIKRLENYYLANTDKLKDGIETMFNLLKKGYDTTQTIIKLIMADRKLIEEHLVIYMSLLVRIKELEEENTHLKYKPPEIGGPGYLEAKSNFEEKNKNNNNTDCSLEFDNSGNIIVTDGKNDNYQMSNTSDNVKNK